MKELHLKKSDFKLIWYSGSGSGGQHRNKHQNCCRIVHIETGIKAQGTESKERKTNLRVAFHRLANKLISHYAEINKPERKISNEVIRVYHDIRNEVVDKASGEKASFKSVVINGDVGNMIKSRKTHIAD